MADLRTSGLGIHGVQLLDFPHHTDQRGAFAEVFRSEWAIDGAPVQWGLGRSTAGVVRGVHVHLRHHDYLCVVEGRMALGLHDLRPSSPTSRRSAMVHLDGTKWQAVSIPPGVAHGFQFPTDAVFLLGMSHYYDDGDELGCRWDDPALGIEWPAPEGMLSPRDRDAGPLADLASLVAARCP